MAKNNSQTTNSLCSSIDISRNAINTVSSFAVCLSDKAPTSYAKT